MIEFVVGGMVALSGVFIGYMVSQASAKENDK